MRRFTILWRVLTLAAAAVGLGLLVYPMGGRWGLLNYFTVLSNLAAVALVLFQLIKQYAWDRPLATALRGAVVLCLMITGLVYNLVLTQPGSQFSMVSDMGDTSAAEASGLLLHTVVPAMALLDWLLFGVGQAKLRLGWAIWWLAVPLLYLAYSLVRGGIAHEYPYPFIDAGALGLGQVLVNACVMAVLIAVLGSILILLGRAGAAIRLRRRPAAHPSRPRR